MSDTGEHQSLPNEERIEVLETRLREIYDYEKLRDCDIHYLHNLERRVDNRIKVFKQPFPDEDGIKGDRRAFVYDDESENREPLTEDERMRLDLLKNEVYTEIRRAKGYRVELRRKHRNKMANSISDAVKGITNLLPRPF